MDKRYSQGGQDTHLVPGLERVTVVINVITISTDVTITITINVGINVIVTVIKGSDYSSHYEDSASFFWTAVRALSVIETANSFMLDRTGNDYVQRGHHLGQIELHELTSFLVNSSVLAHYLDSYIHCKNTACTMYSKPAEKDPLVFKYLDL
jgi:hypothetical protein